VVRYLKLGVTSAGTTGSYATGDILTQIERFVKIGNTLDGKHSDCYNSTVSYQGSAVSRQPES